jgi:hypothetical protein
MSVTFATYAAHKNDLFNNYLLASSIQKFAGSLSDIPLRIYISSDIDVLDEKEKFAGLNVVFSQYPKNTKRHRYAFKPAAASACEADVQSGNVIWLDRHMIVLGPCHELLLNPGESFAYRPPHLKILGASAEKPIDGVWKVVCEIAEVDERTLFPLCTEVDRESIWSYFSAGHFSFKAEAGIMRKWDTLFNHLATHPDMTLFLKDESIRTYLHQIVLTLAVLQHQNENPCTLKPLPALYGYPAHLHNKIEKEHQARQMDEIRTAFYTVHNSAIPKKAISPTLAAWLLTLHTPR